VNGSLPQIMSASRMRVGLLSMCATDKLVKPNAHHHPPEATSAEAKPLGTGRVNDVVRRLIQRSRLSIE
jgi:hypothetical protein